MNQAVMPRVLLLCERLDLAGGVERFVCHLAAALQAEGGLQLAVGSVATPREALAYPLPAEVEVVHGSLDRPLIEGDGLLRIARRQWSVSRSLADVVHTFRPDVLLLNGLTTACAVLPVLPPRLRARALVCDHNHFAARSRLWQALRRRYYPQLAGVVSLTEADAPRFAGLNPHTCVIPNASALQASEPALPQTPTVLAVGRHVAQKGLDMLLEAWARVLPQLPEAQLTLVGEGPLTPVLQVQARQLGLEPSLRWVAAARDMAVHYREAAVFVLPSRYEGLPLALLEAQAMGLPAVAFDCPTGPAEILDASTGLLVPSGDVPALAEALLTLLRDPARRVRMAEAAIRRQRAHFSPAQHLARWSDLIRRTAAAAAGGVR